MKEKSSHAPSIMAMPSEARSSSAGMATRDMLGLQLLGIEIDHLADHFVAMAGVARGAERL